MTTRFCPHPFEPYLRSLVLRLLSARGAAAAFVRSPKFEDSGVPQLLGLNRAKCSQTETIGVLQRMAKAELARTPDSKAPARFKRNLAVLGKIFDLDSECQQVLGFMLLLRADKRLSATVQSVVLCARPEIQRAVARSLGLSEKVVHACLSQEGPLFKTNGLFGNETNVDGYWAGAEFFSNSLANRTVLGGLNPASPVPELGEVAPPSKLSISDWPSLGKELPLLVAYLEASRKSGAKGVNILVHGRTGVGKTELTRVLAREAGFPQTIQIPHFQENGEAMDSSQLFRQLEVIQQIQGRTGNLVIADDAEEMFTGDLALDGEHTPCRRVWFDRVLGSNPAPTVWVLNTMESVAPAFLCRCDMVIHVGSMSVEKRQKHLLDLAGRSIGPEPIRWMAAKDRADLHLAARALAVVRGALDGKPLEARNEAFQTIVSGVLKAQGHEENADGGYNVLADDPDPRWINADYDLACLPEVLRRTPSARICLHGPPGTGKTCFGHWLANELGHPLIVRKASDLLTPFLGETENKIMRAFRQASFRKAVLMLDEVDSFLQDRNRAVRSWEITQVNELLMQMERFQGIFIAATNLMENLDMAALRRFDLKISLRFLDPEQSLSLFERTCHRLGLGTPADEDRRLLGSLGNTTPGDFANVARQHSFRPFPAPADLALAVARECQIKPGQSRPPMGFFCPP